MFGNVDPVARILRLLIDMKRAEETIEGLKAKILEADRQIPSLAKAGNVSEAELKKMRAEASTAAKAFAESRKLAAQKAVATRKQREAVEVDPEAMKKAEASKATALQAVKTAQTAAQGTLLDVPAVKIEKGTKSSPSSKAAKSVRLK